MKIMIIDIEQQRSATERDVWSFSVNYPRVYLSRYALETRATKRHAWRSEPKNLWLKHGRQGAVIRMKKPLKPPLAVILQAINKASSHICYDEN